MTKKGDIRGIGFVKWREGALITAASGQTVEETET